MINFSPKFITDKSSKKIWVVLPLKEFKTMIQELEELEDIRAYDESKSDKQPSVPIDEAFKQISQMPRESF